jgi:hypothetical protein
MHLRKVGGEMLAVEIDLGEEDPGEKGELLSGCVLCACTDWDFTWFTILYLV